MIIPHQDLNPETLENIIEAFILREGTDYGEVECDMATKVAQIKNQLDNGKLVLVYSELYETVNIMPAEQFND